MSHICKYCGIEFPTNQKLGGHVVFCKKNPNYQNTKEKIKFTKSQKIKKYKLKCEVCGKEFELEMSEHVYNTGKYKKTCSIKCHHILCSRNTNKNTKNDKISKSLKKNALEKIKTGKVKKCEYCGVSYMSLHKTNSKYCSEECMIKGRKDKLSINARNRNFGGYNPNSIKKHKQGNYKGIHCDSSWELAFVIYCLDHNIPIKRYKGYRLYIINGKTKKYYPDFIINNNEVIEIKGFMSEHDKMKMEQHKDIKFLFLSDLKEVFEYVHSQYGKNFIELYE